jgi:predicted lipid-binding transport protein (Tim44 family)
MSGQLLELIIFAGIAFFVINKLLSTLGSTTEDDPVKKSNFGEPVSLKDVTPKSAKKTASILRPSFVKKSKLDLKGLIVVENKNDIESGILDLTDKLPNFNPANFLKVSKVAFKMIIEAGRTDENLEELVDKRYLESFKSMAGSYGEYDSDVSKLSALISEIYTFGNNVFVKVLFSGKNITNKIKELHEEWTFTKSTLSEGPEWHLTNIDRPQ